MRTRLTVALLTALALAACSGGGGNSSVPNQNSNGNSQTTQSLTTQESAQTGSEAALSSVEQGDEENGLYNGNMGITLAGMYRTTQSAPDGTCHNGVEKTVTVISPTEKKYDVKYFYDKACTQLAREVVSDVVNNGSGEIITRVATNYNHSALLISTRRTNFSITGTLGSGNFTETAIGSLTIGTSSTPATQHGRSFTVSTASGSNVSTITGNSGHIVNNGNPKVDESFGHSAILSNVTKTTDSSGNIIFAGGRNGTFYKGALGSLTLSSAPPFTISGGTQIGTGSVNGTVTFDNDGELTAINVTAALLDGDTVALSGSGDPITINGTVKDSGGNVLATVVLDGYGDGIITYANGTQGVVTDWHIVA
jgi:hypothetical protein